MSEDRIIGRVLKKPREAIQVKTMTIDRRGAPEMPVVVLEVVELRAAGVWKHPLHRRALAGLTIRADLLDQTIDLLRKAKAQA